MPHPAQRPTYYWCRITDPTRRPISGANIAILELESEVWNIVCLAKTDERGKARLCIPKQRLEKDRIVRIRKFPYYPIEFPVAKLIEYAASEWNNQVQITMTIDPFLAAPL